MTGAFDHARRLVRGAIEKIRDDRNETALRLNAASFLADDAGAALARLSSDGSFVSAEAARILFDLLAVEALFVPDDRLEEALCWQYPNRCRACASVPCECSLARTDRRAEPATNLARIPSASAPQTLRAWQTLLEKIYPNADLTHEEIILRLASEAHEACATALDRAMMRHENEVAVALAQVFAWLCAFASARKFLFEESPRNEKRWGDLYIAFWAKRLRNALV